MSRQTIAAYLAAGTPLARRAFRAILRPRHVAAVSIITVAASLWQLSFAAVVAWRARRHFVGVIAFANALHTRRAPHTLELHDVGLVERTATRGSRHVDARRLIPQTARLWCAGALLALVA